MTVLNIIPTENTAVSVIISATKMPNAEAVVRVRAVFAEKALYFAMGFASGLMRTIVANVG